MREKHEKKIQPLSHLRVKKIFKKPNRRKKHKKRLEAYTIPRKVKILNFFTLPKKPPSSVLISLSVNLKL